jgi:signal transduction histidine kinase
MKLSTIIIVFLSFFIAISLLLRYYLIENTKLKYAKNERILFYELQSESNSLLTYILYQFSNEKENLKKIHSEVFDYLIKSDYEKPLDKIYEKINKNNSIKPYDIYITDENLTIVNTTYKPDLGFNLSFAKETFDEHKKSGIIEASAPIFESYSQKFFSYTDEYLPNSNRIFQVSYTYQNTENKLDKIYTLVDENDTVANYRAYLVLKDGYIGDFIFKKFKGRKLTLDEMNKVKDEAINVFKKIENKSLYEDSFFRDNKEYRTLYSKQESIIFDDIQIIYSLTFDKSFLQKEIDRINNIYFILLIIGFSTTYILFKLRYKEILLRQKDRFIKHSIHEIKTPLSIIKLSNQLRTKIKGEDSYSLKIEAAIKTLDTSYNDMSFAMTKDKFNYETICIDLANFLSNRVEYFNIVAKEQGREIDLMINSNCFIDMSSEELTRLIDNNISNAIKYSSLHSTIQIQLDKNILKFITIGEEIIEKSEIFNKYKRENSSVGGHGLGLSIVKDIINKYNMKVEVQSKDNKNIFIYYFNCHTTDTN